MRRSGAILAALLVAACAGASPEPAATSLRSGTYAGDLPCGDCPAERMVVTLFEDRTFRLRRTYREAAAGRDRSFHDLGRAELAEGRLALRGGSEGGLLFEVVARDRLRLLDREGRRIDSAHPHELARQREVDRLEGPLSLRGMYAYLADAASVEECLTGRRYPVPLVADHVSLERAYLSQRGEPGVPILASFVGRFELREPEPGLPAREHLVVERFERLFPGESCAGPTPASADLRGTHWRAVEIDGEAVALAAGQRAPHFVLSAEDRVSGFAGCNRIAGAFDDSAERFRFAAVASTRMACPGPAGELEARFLAALDATVARSLEGHVLLLRDAEGAVRMRLVAYPAPEEGS
jgi:copper homeostasis protein (lipoprotein)